jgi:predicted nucleic acid-binding Zn ribbon protein
MLARTPVSLARVRLQPPRVRKLRRSRRIAIRDACAAIMREARPTPFRVEAVCRHTLRVSLIFNSWSWAEADNEAALIVQAALQIVGAKRPSPQEGQPEWAQEAVLPILREHCMRCRKPLPPGHWKYCSSICGAAADADRVRFLDREERYAKEKVWRAAWAERQPARDCPTCQRSFRPKRPRQIYCSRSCRDEAGGFTARRRVPTLCEGIPDDPELSKILLPEMPD